MPPGGPTMKIAVYILAALPLSLLPHLLAPGVAALNRQAAGDDGFVPLFNGKDLTGWHNVNCAPGTFYVKDGMIITTGIPTGYLRTAKQYENFILEFEWFHAPKPKGSVGNSGMFVWGDPLPGRGHRLHAQHRGAGPRQSDVQGQARAISPPPARAISSASGGPSASRTARIRPAGNGACRARITARGSTNGTITASSATTASLN